MKGIRNLSKNLRKFFWILKIPDLLSKKDICFLAYILLLFLYVKAVKRNLYRYSGLREVFLVGSAEIAYSSVGEKLYYAVCHCVHHLEVVC